MGDGLGAARKTGNDTDFDRTDPIAGSVSGAD